MSGTPRISVGLIVEAYRAAGGSFDRTAAAFPQLTSDHVRAALDYYAEHTTRIEEDIASNAEALDQVSGWKIPLAGRSQR